jgi:hypothetical protein
LLRGAITLIAGKRLTRLIYDFLDNFSGDHFVVLLLNDADLGETKMNAQIAIAIVGDSDARQDVYCRESLLCFGCGREKAVGLTVCWSCFKYREDITPLKYWTGGLRSWLEMAWSHQAERN